MSQQTTLFNESDVISTYTRKQAIEDGLLVQLSGRGYEGDPWVPEMVAETGFRYPLAMTAAAFAKCVDLTPAAKRACNDLQGRLWDVIPSARLCRVDGVFSRILGNAINSSSANLA